MKDLLEIILVVAICCLLVKSCENNKGVVETAIDQVGYYKEYADSVFGKQ